MTKYDRGPIRDLERSTRISTNSGVVYVKKRSYPQDNTCEVCNKSVKRLHYHHWDDSFPRWGLWVCINCHHKVEAIDHGLADKYEQLKQMVYREVAMSSVNELCQVSGIGAKTAERLLVAIGRSDI